MGRTYSYSVVRGQKIPRFQASLVGILVLAVLIGACGSSGAGSDSGAGGNNATPPLGVAPQTATVPTTVPTVEQKPAGTSNERATDTSPKQAGSGKLGSARDFNIVAYQGGGVLGGDHTSFSKVFAQGKPVVLNLWAGQCPPCRAEMPGFQRVADEYKGRVIFVGVDVGPFTGLGSHDDAKRLLKDLDIRYPAAYAVDTAPLRLYQVVGMPTTVFFTRDGQTLNKVSGALLEDQLRDALNQLLASSS